MSKHYFSFFLLVAGLFFNSAYAQPRKGEFVNVNAGIGLVAPYDEADVTGDGFYAQAEYVWAPKTWFGVRPYAGFVIASGESDKTEVAPGVKEYIKSNAFMLGAKVRIAAPIPYVAPFIETGVGMSLGSFETSTQFVQLKKSGALVHIPFTLGLAIGKRHGTEVKFTYYYHDKVEQFSGAFAVGFSIPINQN
ncbi:MAG: hypothetical protein DI539_02790 [Flavobacterium psychrophilum]|nr:MAG: hypothetical protein DI539_02790 [Flavobacterium psychrophilum]